MSVRLDDVIADLGSDLRPVRRLRPPLLRAAEWLAVVAVLGAALASLANLPAFVARLHTSPDMGLGMLGSMLTAILGALAVFHLSVPGRRPAWALLPLPALALWIAAAGSGCLRTWLSPDPPPFSMEEPRYCFLFIVGLSVPLSVLMIAMIRHACPLRPNLTAAMGGLAVAAAAATLLDFSHSSDDAVLDIAVHVIAITLVVLLNRRFGGRLLDARNTLNSAWRRRTS